MLKVVVRHDFNPSESTEFVNMALLGFIVVDKHCIVILMSNIGLYVFSKCLGTIGSSRFH